MRDSCSYAVFADIRLRLWRGPAEGNVEEVGNGVGAVLASGQGGGGGSRIPECRARGATAGSSRLSLAVREDGLAVGVKQVVFLPL